MPFKSSLVRSAGKLFGVFNQKDLDLRAHTWSRWINEYLGTATGGTVTTPGNGYKYHFITADSQDFVVSGGLMRIDYIIIGGGGGGGAYGGGYTSGGKGTNTVFTISGGTPVTAVGGGGGIAYNRSPPYSPFDGGSGGGGGGNKATSKGDAENYPGPSQQGYPGGTGGSGNDDGGGGGGAGAAGEDAPAPGPGAGGVGKSAFSGDTGIPPSYGTPGPSPGRYFAGGGGGGSRTAGAPGGAGGGGGGGVSTKGTNGTVNTGGGGGGGDNGIGAGHGGGGAGGYAEATGYVIGPGTHDIDIGPGNTPGSPMAGAGGSGIAIIRYLLY